MYSIYSIVSSGNNSKKSESLNIGTLIVFSNDTPALSKTLEGFKRLEQPILLFVT